MQPNLEGAVKNLGISEQVGYLRTSCEKSEALIRDARGYLQATLGGVDGASTDVVLLGSVTRLEVSAQSDFDFLVVAYGLPHLARLGRTAGWLAALALALFLSVMQCGAQQCAGDCDGNGGVSINELVREVNLVLGNGPLDACPVLDRNVDAVITVDELIQAVSDALTDCGVELADVSGVCRHPDATGLTACGAGTRIVVTRCDDRQRCLADIAARTVLADTVTDLGGAFAVRLDSNDATGGL